MTTKIHNGYKLNIAQLEDLFAFNRRLKELMLAENDKLYATRIARDATQSVDLATLGLPSDEQKVRSGATHYSHWVMHHQSRMSECKQSKTRDPLYDYDASWAVLPSPCGLLALLYVESSELAQIWDDQQEVEPFPYWNNSDPEEGFTEEEWEARGNIWNKALGSGVPATHGLSFQIYGNYQGPEFPSVEDLAASAPALDERASSIASTLLSDAHFARLKPDTNRIGSWFVDLGDWRRSPQGKEAKSKLVQYLQSTLSERIAKEQLEAEIQPQSEALSLDAEAIYRILPHDFPDIRPLLPPSAD